MTLIKLSFRSQLYKSPPSSLSPQAQQIRAPLALTVSCAFALFHLEPAHHQEPAFAHSIPLSRVGHSAKQPVLLCCSAWGLERGSARAGRPSFCSTPLVGTHNIPGNKQLPHLYFPEHLSLCREHWPSEETPVGKHRYFWLLCHCQRISKSRP